MEIIINKVAIWRPCGDDKLNKRLSPIGSRFLEDGNPVFRTSSRPLVRYCKKYSKGKTDFCLFVRTENENDVFVEKELDNIAKSLTEKDVLAYLSKCEGMSFVYLNNLIKEVA